MFDSVQDLIKRTFYSLHRDGVGITAKKIKTFLIFKQKRMRQKNSADITCADILFINGCYLGHPARYRVTHQREQLLAKNVTSAEVFYTELDMKLVRQYRAFIFFRCPYTDTIGEFIQAAKDLNKRVIFDIDDLLFDVDYTKTVSYIDTMPTDRKKGYYESIEMIQKTLRLCEAAVTTTEVLANELRKFVPNVYINRNLMSEEMVYLSERAVDSKKEHQEIRIGYFSGSITHNEDVEMLVPVLVRIFQKYPQVKLWLAGELDLPQGLKLYKNRIRTVQFCAWTELPRLIASVEINIAPLKDTLFNRAKSENKWMEAALVKVPTIASKVGAFEEAIEQNVTGILCATEEEWFIALGRLIEDKAFRAEIAGNAYDYVKKNCVTITKSGEYARYLKGLFRTNLFMVLPVVRTAGGILVAFRHCTMLMKAGIDVTILNEGCEDNQYVEMDGVKIPVLAKRELTIEQSIDKGVATLWNTMEFVRNYPKIAERYYLVQSYETDFYKSGDDMRIKAEQSYSSGVDIHFITTSQWCQKWLVEKYQCNVNYTPNGIDDQVFYPIKRKFERKKIRVLIEGNSLDYYKNVDESFEIVDTLDKDKYEIWYMAYRGKPKSNYYVDKFLYNVPPNKVGDVYRECDILLKTSILESFSYPPLEMMATGGYVVVVPNDGNVEYLVNEENCLMYDQGNIRQAVECIERIIEDNELRDKLYQCGIETAQKREWGILEKEICAAYRC